MRFEQHPIYCLENHTVLNTCDNVYIATYLISGQLKTLELTSICQFNMCSKACWHKIHKLTSTAIPAEICLWKTTSLIEKHEYTALTETLKYHDEGKISFMKPSELICTSVVSSVWWSTQCDVSPDMPRSLAVTKSCILLDANRW